MKHDDTRIYQRSLELVRLSKQVLERLPPGYGFLRGELRRASSSVPLNFSEGYSKSTLKEQRRFFGIAKASAYEVSAIFDVAACFEVVPAHLLLEGKDLCDHLAAMLSRFR